MECVICYEKKFCFESNCGHHFCADCLQNWFDTVIHFQCPYCRQPFLLKTKVQTRNFLQTYNNLIVNYFKILAREHFVKMSLFLQQTNPDINEINSEIVRFFQILMFEPSIIHHSPVINVFVKCVHNTPSYKSAIDSFPAPEKKIIKNAINYLKK